MGNLHFADAVWVRDQLGATEAALAAAAGERVGEAAREM